MTPPSSHPVDRFLPYELIAQKNSAHDFPQPQRHPQQLHKPRHNNTRDCWMTLATAVILGSISLICLSLAIFKFGSALKFDQSISPKVPESITHRALSHRQ